MGAPFHQHRDKNLYLVDTICSYKGQPHFVSVYGYNLRETEVDVTPLVHDGKEFRIQYTSDDFDYNPGYTLGYINFADACAYSVREPRRIVRKGLAIDSIKMINCPYSLPHRWFVSEDLGNTLLNKYPSIKDAHALVDGGAAKGKAFNSSLSIHSDQIPGVLTLSHKGFPVGYFLGQRIILFSTKPNTILSSYLKELLKDAFEVQTT